MNPGKTNDSGNFKPVTDFSGPSLQFEMPGLSIGVAEYAEGPTGCTVFRLPKGSTGVTDMRGGAPGTVLSHREGWVDAICLAGGSVYGLEASAGVSAELLADKGFDTDWMNIAIVSGAIIFDFNKFRSNRSVYPDKELGRAAVRAARPGVFPMGPRGAGACATVGKWLRAPYAFERGGQGAAWHQKGPVSTAVFTVVNSVGAIIGRDGRAVRGHLDVKTEQRYRVSDVVSLDELSSDAVSASTPVNGESSGPPPGNTTLTVVITNQALSIRELNQLARQVHGSMARAIDPFHTLHDGDVLYAISTNEIKTVELKYHELAFVASELAWDAVLRSF